MSPTRPTSTRTLGAELERDRLERRGRSMTVAIDSLRRYASEHRREPPRHVRQAVADFDAQIAAMTFGCANSPTTVVNRRRGMERLR
jgi:hypothetical protein